jgi:ABC-2 type transport system ATP-binding protein
MVDGRIDALDNPNQLKHTHGVKTMDEVFLKLARKAVRSE